MQAVRMVLALGTALMLAACADPVPELMNLRSSSNGPDEFAILPPKALELPEDLTALPEPTPGGTNRTDQDPYGAAIVALGGTPLATDGAQPAADAALLAHAGRLGLDPNIRTLLAAEDLEWRRTNNGRILERIFAVNVYFKAYAPQALDQQAELARWRQAGVRTPSAPPRQDGER
jgi:hypothetical protein